MRRFPILLTLALTLSNAACADLLCAQDVQTEQQNAETKQTQAPAIDLGSQRELFIDDYLIQSLQNAAIVPHSPERKNIAMTFDKPWEGESEGYFTILKTDEKYLMFYRAWGIQYGIPMSICRLESLDGINWTRPKYEMCEFEGSKANNIILKELFPGSQMGTHDFTPFLDERPNCPPDEKYKSLGYGWLADGADGKHGLYAWKSADGLHWSLMQDDPVYTDGKFDTQNIAFWSKKENKYVLYYREFRSEIRVVFRATSDDFIHWKNEGEIAFPAGDGPTLREQMYTNQIQPYYRAPQIYIGLPTRYVDNGMTATTPKLPEWDEREPRMKIYKGGDRLGTATTDVIRIASRDGKNFQKADEPFIKPGLRVKDNWFYGDNYLAWNIVETPSADEDSPNELSLYGVESSSTHNDAKIRRFALRIDGFGSIHAKAEQGEALTKPLTFQGKELSLNVSTSSAGVVYVELQDESGAPIPGFTAEDCDPIYGDYLDFRVTWHGSADVSKLAGKTIKLRFKLYEADIYSLKFEE